MQYGVDRGAAPDASADVVGTPVDAGQETSIDAGPTLAKVPARPTIDDGTEDLRIVLATDWASPLPDGDGGVTEGTLGYDLDNTATCPGTASCTPPENVDLTAQCDGPGGRDNGFARMLKGFGDTAFTSELSADIENGRAGIVTVIENYNGGKNDTKVRAWAVVSTGTQVQLPDGGPDPVRTPTPPLPKLDGQDIWSVSPDGLQGGGPPVGTNCGDPADPCKPIAPDDDAYVVDGVLVTRVDFPVAIPSLGPTARLDIRGGYMVARIIKTPQGLYRLVDGQVVGRVPPQDVLKVAGLFNDPFSPGKALCQSALSLGVTRSTVCKFRDIHADLTKDGLPTPCDGISTAMAFRATQARFGSVRQAERDGGVTCPPDSDYNCPK